MATQTITVGEIKIREVNTKRGVAKAFDIVDTAGTKYQFGFTDPNKVGASVGSTISGEVTISTYGLAMDPKSVRTGGAPGEAAKPSTTTPTSYPRTGGTSGYKEKTFPVPPTHGDMAIIRQNALTNAVATVADYIATQDSAKWPDLNKWGDMVIEVAYKYAKFSSGHRETEAIAALQAAGVPSASIAAAVDASLEAE
jgi:hypothetical protein